MKKYVTAILLAFVLTVSGISGSVAYGETIWVDLVGNDIVLDSFNGVTANYTANYNSDSDKVYSCAAYVKKYYSQIYGVTVYNLMDNGPLKLLESNNSLIKVKEPQIGDIIFYPISKNPYNHSAIVKEIEGNTITLIEQNYKTGKRAAYNRTITYPSDKYEIWRLTDQSNINIPQNGTTENDILIASEDVISRIAMYTDKTITNVSGSSQNPEIIANSDNKYSSYILENGIEYTFIVPHTGVLCWYSDGNSYLLADSLKMVTTTKAYFTFFDEGLYDTLDFKDMDESHWAHYSFQKCVEEGLLNVFEDGTARPNDSITRKDFAVMISKLLQINLDEYITSSTFSDVYENDSYKTYIEAAKYYMLGFEEDGQLKYNPLKYTTREDAFTAAIKMLNAPLNSIVNLGFDDSDKITPSLVPYIKKSLELGLTSANNKSFRPKDYITRAEVSLVFYKLYKDLSVITD